MGLKTSFRRLKYVIFRIQASHFMAQEVGIFSGARDAILWTLEIRHFVGVYKWFFGSTIGTLWV